MERHLKINHWSILVAFGYPLSAFRYPIYGSTMATYWATGDTSRPARVTAPRISESLDTSGAWYCTNETFRERKNSSRHDYSANSVSEYPPCWYSMHSERYDSLTRWI